jgi:hypothetical protein
MSKFSFHASQACESHRTPFIEAMEGRSLMSATLLPYVETAPSDPAPTADGTVVVQKVTVSDISIVKTVNKASPILFSY